MPALRVVRGGYHDAGIAFIISCCKGKRRNGHQGVIDSHVDAIGGQHACGFLGKDIAFQPAVIGQHACGFLGKDIALQPAVIGNGNRLAAALCEYPVSKPLGCLAYYPDVHPVGAGTECSAQTGGTELQGNRKTVFNLILVVPDFQQLRQQIGILQVVGQPAFVFFSDHHLSPFLVVIFVLPVR